METSGKVRARHKGRFDRLEDRECFDCATGRPIEPRLLSMGGNEFALLANCSGALARRIFFLQPNILHCLTF